MPRTPFPRRRAIATLVVAAAGALTAAAPAAGATLTLTPSADPAEDRPMTITSSGTADESSSLVVLVRNAGGAPCAASASTDTGGDRINNGTTIPAGSYTSTRQLERSQPGTYLVCGWLQRDGETKAAATTTFTVRPNAATLTLEVPPAALPEQPFIVKASGTTEVNRDLYVLIKAAGGAPCGSSLATDPGGDRIYNGTLISGAFALQRETSVRAGSYLLCAWVLEGSGDLEPEAFSSATISVQPPDADADGIPDAADLCPARSGPGTATGCPARVAPTGLTAKVAPARDRKRPYAFRFSGGLTAPAGYSAAEACKGTVSVQIKRGTKTISTRRVGLKPDCRWSSSVSFRDRSRVGRKGKLKAVVRFLGNDLLSPRGAKTLKLRAG